MKVLSLSVAMVVMAALLVSDVSASKKFVARLPNGGNVPNTPAIGHSDGTGDDEATNAFGDAFAAAGKKWTKELCQADSDGDGQTNGQELGDPCCEWDQTANPVTRWSTGVSNPGDASKKSDSSLWASITCGSSSSTTSSPSTTTAPSSGSSPSTGSSGTPSPTTASSTSSTPSTSTNASSSTPSSTQSLRACTYGTK